MCNIIYNCDSLRDYPATHELIKMAETIKGLEALLKAFGAFGEEVDKSIIKAVKLTANEYKKDVQKVAPYDSGTYRRSIHVEMSGKVALVGTNLPYARRLEYGFADVDSLGRVYDQKAQPHFRPTFDENIEKYKQKFKESLFG